MTIPFAARRCLGALVLLMASLVLTSCGNEEGFTPRPAPQGNLRMVNAMPDSPALRFIVDERAEAGLAFGQASSFVATLPDIPIPIQVIYLDGSNNAVTVLTDQITIQNGRDATILVAGTLDSPRLMLIDNPPVDFGENPAQAEIQFAHAATNAPRSIDIIVDEDGTPATEATVTFGESSPVESLTGNANVEIRARATGEQADLWSSGPLSLAAATRRLILAVDYFGPAGNAFRLVQIGEAGTLTFPEEALPAAVRVANMTPDRAPLDVTINGQTFAENVAFAEVTDYVETPAGELAIEVRPFGQPDTLISDNTLAAFTGNFHTLVLSGSGDENTSKLSTDDRRRVPIQLRLSVTHASPAANPDGNNNALDLYLLEPGDTVSDQSANARLFYLDTISLSFIGGARDLVLTPAGTEEIAFGPQRLDLTNGNLYQLFITDSAGGGLPIEVVLEDDFRP